MRLVRHLLGIIAGASVLMALGVSSSVARPAAEEMLGLSPDGSAPWTSSLTEPLFDADFRWVPGDTEVGEFWVRNQSTGAGEMRLIVVPRVEDPHAAGGLDLQIRLGAEDWEPLTTVWTSPWRLAAGTKARVQIRAALAPTAPNSSQNLAFSFDVGARLTAASGTAIETRPTPTPTPSTEPTRAADKAVGNGTQERGDATSGALAGTGARLPAWLVPVGVGATITGLWLALAARRRDEKRENS